jgi:hypothetical protein
MKPINKDLVVDWAYTKPSDDWYRKYILCEWYVMSGNKPTVPLETCPVVKAGMDLATKPASCSHYYREYLGLRECFWYCVKCDHKRSNSNV